MSRRGLLIGALLTALAVGVWQRFEWPTGAGVPTHPAGTNGDALAVSAVPPATVKSDAETAAIANAENPTPPAASLASNTLMAELPTLEKRFKQGDRAAGWRAYEELAQCRFQVGIDALAKAAASARANSVLASTGARAAAWIDPEKSRYCVGSEALSAARAFDLLLRLAELGDLQAQLQFTLDPPLYRMRALAELDLIVRYRERAPALLERALKAGSLGALTALLDAHTPAEQERLEDASMYVSSPRAAEPGASAMAYLQRFSATRSTREPPHRQIVTPDPAEAYRLALVCQRACTDSIWLDRANRTVAAAESRLDPGERLRLGSAADRLYLDAFMHPANEEPVSWGAWWNAL